MCPREAEMSKTESRQWIGKKNEWRMSAAIHTIAKNLEGKQDRTAREGRANRGRQRRLSARFVALYALQVVQGSEMNEQQALN